MQRIPLYGGSYEARSVIANAQRCINYYPEANRGDAPTPFTYYQRPGLKPLVTGNHAPVRGVYRATNDNGYCVIGQTVYSIDPNWKLTAIGALNIPGLNPVSFVDNGETIMLVDNSNFGFTIDMVTNAFAQISDPTGTFNGGTRVDYIDTFIIWNIIGTRDFGSTLSGEIVFDALQFAGKVGYADAIQSLIVNRREIILLGKLKSEVWYDAGNAGFPFAELPGAYIEHGGVAPFSLAATDIEVFWLGQDLQGDGIVFELKGYDTRRISNFALEWAIRQMKAKGNIISDAIGYTWQQNGHVFYVLTFPTGNQTWVYDASLGSDPSIAWHQIACTDANGRLQRHRGMCYANLYGQQVVGDFENGTLYALDPNTYTDTIGGIITPITYIKGFPHILKAANPKGGNMMEAGGKNIIFGKFILDIEGGNAPLDADGNPTQVGLKWSVNRGRTWGETVLQGIGIPGQYEAQPQWPQEGMSWDMVFEIQHSIAGPAALQGAWVEATLAMA